MTTKLEKVKFRGENYVVKSRLDSPSGTLEQYRHCTEPFAFIYEDGKIRRYGEIIGTVEEVEYSGEYVEIEHAGGAIDNLLDALMGISSGDGE